MVTLKKIISVSLTPLLWINLAGMGLAALWLGLLSQWQVLWLGLPMIFFSTYFIPILLMPAGIFSHFMSLYHAAKRPDKERLMFILSTAYVVLFFAAWGAVIFSYVMHRAPAAPWGALLWANSMAVAPLLMWVSRDPGNTFIITMIGMVQIILLVASLLWVSGVAFTFWPYFTFSAGLLGLVAAGQACYEERQAKNPG